MRYGPTLLHTLTTLHLRFLINITRKANFVILFLISLFLIHFYTELVPGSCSIYSLKKNCRKKFLVLNYIKEIYYKRWILNYPLWLSFTFSYVVKMVAQEINKIYANLSCNNKAEHIFYINLDLTILICIKFGDHSSLLLDTSNFHTVMSKKVDELLFTLAWDVIHRSIVHLLCF